MEMKPRAESQAREVYILRDQIGQGNPFLHGQNEYQILHEVEVDGQHYAVLQKREDHPDDAYLFRIDQQQPVEIEDETEWENVAEAVDNLLYDRNEGSMS